PPDSNKIGGGNDGSIWNPFLAPLHEITGATLITYDRPGYGQSELNPNLADEEKSLIDHGITDLQKALKALGYNKEILLVSHSYGGFYSAFFAANTPDQVKGIVLIDANLNSFWTEDFLARKKKEQTEAWLDYVKGISLGVYYECLALEQTVRNVRKLSFPDHIPIIDLVAEHPPEFSLESDRDRWKAHHQKFADASPNRKGIMAYDCRHYLHYDNPALLINSIVALYTEVNPQIDHSQILTKSLEYNTQRANEYRQMEYDYWHSERAINAWGYELMNEGERGKALKIFELNVALFPDSWNVYDSYGEALLATGEKDKALEMYKKSLILNPENEAAKEVLDQHK
ncbi:MAG: alpha/beta fold hydrolase, partial [Bacteroidota bacterium]